MTFSVIIYHIPFTKGLEISKLDRNTVFHRTL